MFASQLEVFKLLLKLVPFFFERLHGVFVVLLHALLGLVGGFLHLLRALLLAVPGIVVLLDQAVVFAFLLLPPLLLVLNPFVQLFSLLLLDSRERLRPLRQLLALPRHRINLFIGSSQMFLPQDLQV